METHPAETQLHQWHPGAHSEIQMENPQARTLSTLPLSGLKLSCSTPRGLAQLFSCPGKYRPQRGTGAEGGTPSPKQPFPGSGCPLPLLTFIPLGRADPLSGSPIPSQTHLTTHSRPQRHIRLQRQARSHVHLYFHCSALTHALRHTHTSSYTYTLAIPGAQSHIHRTESFTGLHTNSETSFLLPSSDLCLYLPPQGPGSL